MTWWDRNVLPFLVEKACRSTQILAERKRWIPEARGDVLEIGIGSGLNLPFYDRISSLTAIDTSPELLTRARRRATFPIDFVLGDAEALPFDRRFDTVVATYTLCSVRSLERTLAEVRRVLAPDGRFILVEHGVSPEPSTARWQRRITPLWKRVAGNCHLDRDIRGALAAAGFDIGDAVSGDDDAPRWMSYTTRGCLRLA